MNVTFRPIERPRPTPSPDWLKREAQKLLDELPAPTPPKPKPKTMPPVDLDRIRNRLDEIGRLLEYELARYNEGAR
jgi:hypothetical protein